MILRLEEISDLQRSERLETKVCVINNSPFDASAQLHHDVITSQYLTFLKSYPHHDYFSDTFIDINSPLSNVRPQMFLQPSSFLKSGSKTLGLYCIHLNDILQVVSSL